MRIFGIVGMPLPDFFFFFVRNHEFSFGRLLLLRVNAAESYRNSPSITMRNPIDVKLHVFTDHDGNHI